MRAGFKFQQVNTELNSELEYVNQIDNFMAGFLCLLT
jgi:hypothetical protein